MSKHLPLLQYNPWSPSKADLAGTCGLAFKYRYVDRIKGGTRGSAAKVGVTVHLAQELVLQGVTASDALDQAIAEVEEDLTTNDEEKARTFYDSLVAFKNKIDAFSEKHEVETLFLEQKWAITPEFTPCEFFDDGGMIRGIIDMGLLLKSGQLIIIDHKSGRLRPIKYYGTQLDIYSVMAQAHYPEVQGVQCALNFMAADKVSWGSHQSTKHITSILRPWLVKYLNRRATNLKDFAAKPGRLCSWCDYKTICPELGGNGKAGEATG